MKNNVRGKTGDDLTENEMREVVDGNTENKKKRIFPFHRLLVQHKTGTDTRRRRHKRHVPNQNLRRRSYTTHG